jgi:hypothetical protein
MSERIDKKELVNRVSQRIGRDTDTVSEVVEAMLVVWVVVFIQRGTLACPSFYSAQIP